MPGFAPRCKQKSLVTIASAEFGRSKSSVGAKGLQWQIHSIAIACRTLPKIAE